ncbi:MAG: glutathione peroxidase [Chitinophagales bacterium]|nr:glutathione peroxidase [Chitinophagales bacterium]MDW8273452.1 glutathione peroxidase [Chitinophagales bacterium]
MISTLASLLGFSKKHPPLNPPVQSVHEFTMKTIDGKELSLSTFKGKVLLIVNVASKCGLTPQYKEIEALYRKYKDKGLVVLGFPANNFLGQEPGTDKEIKEFCTTKYDVTFPMFSKISVKGKDQHPLYQYLTQKSNNGVIDADVKWNFQKFLVDKNGKVITSFSPQTSVNDESVIREIEKALAAR